VKEDSGFTIDPWMVREEHLDLGLLPQSESVFALANGHVGLRGNLDEGEPSGIPGTYLSGYHEQRPLPHAETAYGYPESSETMVNVTDGKLIRLAIDDEPLDVRLGILHHHERELDLRAGTLNRTLDWTSPAGKRVKVASRRMVSFMQRTIAAIEYTVEPVSDPVRVILQSELVANESSAASSLDPRAATALGSVLLPVERHSEDHVSVLTHRTRASELLITVGMQHAVSSSAPYDMDTQCHDDWIRTSIVCSLRPGQRLRVVKFLAYGWSSLRSRAALRDQVDAALLGASSSAWSGLLDEQRRYLDDYWAAADVEVEGDPALQQAVRFGLFHILQAGARSEGRGLPAKGLTGPGYDGHTFWDSEAFVLPVLTYTHPAAAADALRWRATTLELARDRARTLALAGATFPWRTIGGQESSGYWPAGTAAFHINADVAEAFDHYRRVTGDHTLEEKGGGLEVLVETARLWMALGRYDAEGGFHLDGMTGPDEYSALADDNVFTNLMAARNLQAAAEAVQRRPERCPGLGVTSSEVLSWQLAAAAMHLPYDEQLGIHQQAAGFTQHREWDFARHGDKYPLLLHAHYFDLYRSQVIKQADLVLAMHRCPDAFTEEEKAYNFDYYDRRTVRDSSLSASTQAVMAAEVGHLELAHDYAYEAATIDLRDLHQNTSDGLHIASLAGAWSALVSGFGGLRDHDGVLSFNPALPDGITRLRFGVTWRAMRLRVDIRTGVVTYTRDDDQPGVLNLRHAGEILEVPLGASVWRSLGARTALLPPPPPPLFRRPTRPSPDQGPELDPGLDEAS
jgi:trehalose/maltose hydrolase-like predicted phosphorylase